jgi:hypothetical protein
VTASKTAEAMAGIAAVALILDSLEVLANRDAYSRDGIFSYDVLGATRRYLAASPIASAARVLYSYAGVLVLTSLQLVCGVALLAEFVVSTEQRMALVGVAALVAAVSRMLLRARSHLGGEGGDEILLIVLLSIGATAGLAGSGAAWVAACYPGMQLLLAYEVAGIAKLAGAEWRSGQAIVNINRTMLFGNQRVYRCVRGRPRVASAVSRAVIAMECGMPLLIFAGVPGAWAIVMIGLAFHIAVAFMMGLNSFVWCFGSAYPSLLLLAHHVPHLGV